MIKYTSDEIESLLRFQNRRLLNSMVARILTLFENLHDEHQDAMDKLENALPEQYKTYVNLIDYWSQTRADMIRKAVLDDGGNTTRALDEMLVNYDIKLKQ